MIKNCNLYYFIQYLEKNILILLYYNDKFNKLSHRHHGQALLTPINAIGRRPCLAENAACAPRCA